MILARGAFYQIPLISEIFFSHKIKCNGMTRFMDFMCALASLFVVDAILGIIPHVGGIKRLSLGSEFSGSV